MNMNSTREAIRRSERGGLVVRVGLPAPAARPPAAGPAAAVAVVAARLAVEGGGDARRLLAAARAAALCAARRAAARVAVVAAAARVHTCARAVQYAREYSFRSTANNKYCVQYMYVQYSRRRRGVKGPDGGESRAGQKWVPGLPRSGRRSDTCRCAPNTMPDCVANLLVPIWKPIAQHSTAEGRHESMALNKWKSTFFLSGPSI